MFEVAFEWESAPGVASEALARTWARLELNHRGRPLSRFWCEPTQAVRKGVHLSLLPLASWIARHWWQLLNEGPALGDTTQGPRSVRSTWARQWFQRHNLLFAREGMAHPDLSIMRIDDQLGLTWRADPAQTPTPGRFLDSGALVAPTAEVASALYRLVEAVLARLDGCMDPAVEEFAADWQAVRASMIEEPKFCSWVGSLGLDPYSDEADALADPLEALDLDGLLMRDLLAVSSSKTLTDNATVVQELLGALDSKTSVRLAPEQPRTAGAEAYSAGFQRARWLRSKLGLADDAPIKTLEDVMEKALGSGFHCSFADRFESDVEAVVEANGVSGAALGHRSSKRDRRFHLARVVHHALFATSEGHPIRLLTRSHDWQQSASRSFAAELLAPAAGLESRMGATAWVDESKLARLFDVSPQVIRHQLSNHGLV